MQHFNLNKLPFENVPDPLFFYNSGDHARIRNQISGSLQSGRGLIVVTGPIGSGKTTLSQMIKADFPDDIKLIWMAEPPATSADLYLFLAQELGLQPSSSEKTFVMRDIRNTLMKINSEGRKCLVIIDESHLMTDDVINGIRLLNNLEEGSIKLIQLLLLGQEELMEMINKPIMEPFKQRIAALAALGRMNVDAVRNYISHRIKVAGGNPDLISDTGWEAISIAFHAGGTPRTINSLCDRSFSVAFEQNKPAVDAHHVYEATQRLGLRTDVFHYIISLKSKERKSYEIPTYEVPTVTDKIVSQTPSEVPSSEKHPAGVSDSTEETLALPRTKQSTNSKNSSVPADYGASKGIKGLLYGNIDHISNEKHNNRNLQIPAMLLSISLIALMLSLLFFCHKTDSEGVINCMMNLFNS